MNDNLWFVDYIIEWDKDTFLHLTVSDGFFIYLTRKPNSHNNRIWSVTPDEIPDEEHYQELLNSTDCVGVFVLLTSCRLMWAMKLHSQSWDGA